jgi:hypothetical protein
VEPNYIGRSLYKHNNGWMGYLKKLILVLNILKVHSFKPLNTKFNLNHKLLGRTNVRNPFFQLVSKFLFIEKSTEDLRWLYVKAFGSAHSHYINIVCAVPALFRF